MGKKEPPPVCRPRDGGDHMILKIHCEYITKMGESQ